jgi:hypothetical protein
VHDISFDVGSQVPESATSASTSSSLTPHRRLVVLELQHSGSLSTLGLGGGGMSAEREGWLGQVVSARVGNAGMDRPLWDSSSVCSVLCAYAS